MSAPNPTLAKAGMNNAPNPFWEITIPPFKPIASRR